MSGKGFDQTPGHSLGNGGYGNRDRTDNQPSERSSDDDVVAGLLKAVEGVEKLTDQQLVDACIRDKFRGGSTTIAMLCRRILRNLATTKERAKKRRKAGKTKVRRVKP